MLKLQVYFLIVDFRGASLKPVQMWRGVQEEFLIGNGDPRAMEVPRVAKARRQHPGVFGALGPSASGPRESHNVKSTRYGGTREAKAGEL